MPCSLQEGEGTLFFVRSGLASVAELIAMDAFGTWNEAPTL